MSIISRLLKGAGYVRQTPLAEFAGAQIAPELGPAWRVMDGIDYAQPPVIAAHIAEEPELRDKYLREALEPYRTQFGSPYAQGSPFRELGFSTVLNPLMEWDWTTRRYVIEQCHLAWERHPLAKIAVRMSRVFSVQNGHAMTYTNPEVEKVLEAFRDEPMNNVRDLDKMALEALHLDGEMFIRFVEGGGDQGGVPGQVVIVPLRPWYIQWIKANPANFRDIESYQYVGSIADGSGTEVETYNEAIPAGEVHHVAINRLPYEQRGRPELFAVLPYLQGYKRWLEDRARQNAFRGAVYDVSLRNASAGQVAARASAYRKPMMAGTVNVHNDNEVFSVMEQLVHASDASEDGRQIRLMVAAGMGLPEYMLSDGSNANLASATAQQLPALKTFAEWKDIMIDQFWRPIFDRVIRANVEAGVLPEMVGLCRTDGEPVMGDDGQQETVSVYDAYEVSYGEDDQLDKLNAVSALLAAVNAGIMSDQTATENMPYGLEYSVEQERINAERAKSMGDMMAGRVPMPPGVDPATGLPGLPGLPPEPTQADADELEIEGADNETE